jgi:hypothetical protein
VKLPLALRALWFRRGVSLAVVVVATFVVTAAAAGPLYLRAAGESLLQDALRTAGADGAGIETTLLAPAESRPREALAAATRQALAGRAAGHRAAFARPILAAEADDVLAAAGGVAVRLTARDGACGQLRLHGRCPSAAGEVIVSQRLATRLRLKTDARLSLAAAGAVRIVGTYSVRDESAAYWFARSYFPPPGSTDERTGAELGDALFTVPTTLDELPGATPVRAVADLPAAVGTLRLADADEATRQSRDVVTGYLAAEPGVQTRSSLPDILDRTQASARLLRAPVLLIVLQLLVLSWLVLFTVVANSVDARGPEVGLAKLRGLPAGATVAFGLLEPAILLLLAVPLGLLLAVAAVGAIARSQFVGSVPVGWTVTALAAAGLATLGGGIAAGLAARGTLRRPALEQFRRTTASGTRRPWATEAAVITLAVAGLVQLVVSGAVSRGEVDPTALLAPGLLSLAAGLVAARGLPAVCRGLAAPTRARRRLGLFLAVRQVARRPGGARTVVVLVVAFGLATFSVSAWSVARDNRQARALTVTGAPVVLTVSGGTRDVAEVVRAADPGGTWAMAVSEQQLLSSSASGRRVLAVDTARFAAVAYWRGDFADRSKAQIAAALHPPAGPVVRLRGPSLAVTVRTSRLGVTDLPLTVAHLSALVVDRSGRRVTVDLGPLPATAGRLSASVPCRDGCRLAGLQLTKTEFAEVYGSFVVTQIVDGQGAVDAGLTDAARWRPISPDDPPTLRAGPEGLTVDVATAASSAPIWAPSDSPVPLPAVVTASLTSGPSGQPQALGLDRAALPVAVVTTARALPRAQADGLLIDREYALRQAVTGSTATESVWLGVNAPADARDRLSAAGLVISTEERATDQVRALSREAPALALLLFLLGAAAAAVLAAGGTLLDLYVLGRRRIGELSAVRALGVRRRALVSALLLEQGILVGTGAVVGVAAGVAGALLALPSVPEFEQLPEAPPLRYVPSAALLTALVVGTLLVLAVTIVTAVLGLVRGVRPERLREGPS